MRTNINHNLTFLAIVSTFAVLSIILFLNFQSVYSKNPEVSYLDVNDTSSVSKFTVASWFKTSNNYKSDAFIVNKDGDGGNMNYGIWMTNTEKIQGGFENSKGKPMYVTSPLSYSDGKWHYAMVTFDGSTINLYVDGVYVATESASGSPDNGGNEPVRVGANSEQPSDYFIGDVDEVRVWKSALTPLDAAYAYNGKFNTKNQVLYLGFSQPILSLNNTAQINATATNETDIQEFNATSINETGIQGINATARNETGIQGINATARNETGIQGINATARNETGIQGINATARNETGPLTTLITKNETGNLNDTGDTIQPVEKPQIINDTGIVNDTGTVEQQAAPQQENNSPESFDQSVSVDQDRQVGITLVADDQDNDPLQFDITADPLQGSIDSFDKGKGTLTYIPKEGYSGNDEFRFRVIDDKGSESNVAQVDVSIKEVTQSNETQETELAKSKEAISNQTGTEQGAQTSPVEEPNQPPKADAGDDKKAQVNTEVKLDGGKSSDEDGKIVSYKWEQTDGPKVDPKNADGETATFDVPESAADSKLAFKLTVVDDKDASSSDDVTVEVEKISTAESNPNDESNDKGKPN
jgi:Concanavalin A-like lectin/glucanases superfamily/K319L-like, PKD domain/Bacterial Ig domain